jgi:hypothetical protein
MLKSNLIFAAGLSLTLSGCIIIDKDSENLVDRGECTSNNPNMAIQTAVYGTGSAVAIGCSREASLTDRYLEISLKTDYSVSAGSNSFYHIGRGSISTISKYSFLEPSIKQSSFSTNDASESSSNPHKLIEVSNTKAYLIRYNKSKVWIVNPSAVNEEEYKVGELDLSAYLVSSGNTTSTATDMKDAIVVDGKLFIAMQRLRNGSQFNGFDNYDYTNSSMVAVFNIENDIEIDASPNNDNFKGITLTGRNVQTLSVFGNKIYTASRGNYSQDYGLLEAINISDYSVTPLVQGTAELGHIADTTILSATKGFILGDLSGYPIPGVYENYTYKHNIYPFNPSTGQIDAAMTDFNNTHLTDIEIGPDNYLWVLSAVNSKPGVYKVDTTGVEDNIFLQTNLNPINIAFKQ